MQNVEQIAANVALNQPSTIQKGDKLGIFVTAKDMEVVRPFNQNYYNNELSTTASAANTQKEYLVDSQGNITFPVIGDVSTTGKTVEQLKEFLYTKIANYVKNPTVNVTLANFKVTILGEVNKPGQYSIPESNTSLLSAIGLAEDLTVYGKREDVLMVRNENGVITKARINLLDSDFFNSPYFMLKQGDVIYVSSNSTKEKIARQDPNTGIYIAIAGTLVGLAGIFITIFKK
ncbi:polysaccharide biosynthesis/export family protein [Kaistella gelatinilytica]|nr:polysaccharide biosynthesis/export family protein [Kaistella gelatinilytica]